MTEVEKIVVRLIGDGSSYQTMLLRAKAATISATATFRTMNARLLMIGRTMRAVGASIQRFGLQISRVGRIILQSITLPVIAASVAILKLGGDFESEMSKIVGLVGVAEIQVAQWSDEILKLGPALGKAPKELALAMFQVTSAGFRGAAAMDVLTASGKASAAGLGETLVIADAVTSAVNAYGLENLGAAEATDILVAAVREGKLEASTLASVMGALLPLTSRLGIEFDNVAGAIAAMSRTGTSAAEGATQISGFLTSLLKPTQPARDALEGVGLSFQQLRDTVRDGGILDAMRQVGDAFDGSNTALATIFPNVRAMRSAMNLLTQDADTVDSVMEGVANATGSTDAAFAAATKTIKFKFNQALSQLKATFISFDKTVFPILTDFFVSMNKVLKSIRELPEENKKMIVTFLGLAAALGPVLLVVGPIVAALGGFVIMIASVVTATVPFMLGIGGMISSVFGFVSAIIGVLIPAFLLIIEPLIAMPILIFAFISALTGFVIALVGAFKTAPVDELKETFKEFFTDFGQSISGMVEEIASLASVWKSSWSSMSGAMKAGNITGAVDVAMKTIELSVAKSSSAMAKAWEESIFTMKTSWLEFKKWWSIEEWLQFDDKDLQDIFGMPKPENKEQTALETDYADFLDAGSANVKTLTDELKKLTDQVKIDNIQIGIDRVNTSFAEADAASFAAMDASNVDDVAEVAEKAREEFWPLFNDVNTMIDDMSDIQVNFNVQDAALIGSAEDIARMAEFRALTTSTKTPSAGILFSPEEKRVMDSAITSIPDNSMDNALRQDPTFLNESKGLLEGRGGLGPDNNGLLSIDEKLARMIELAEESNEEEEFTTVPLE